MRARTNTPRAVVRRMVQYLVYLEEKQKGDDEWVSSQEIAEALDLTSATVRRDLLHLDFSGTASRGYEIGTLRSRLSAFLGLAVKWKVAIIGAGNLGKALALHSAWPRRGFKICAIFDKDRRKVGTRVGGITVQHVDELPAAIRTAGLQIAVLAVPADAAQSVADIAIVSGIRGILNLALTHIVAPPHVCVFNGRLEANMIALAHGILHAPFPSRAHSNEVETC
jgi:redox-sensing transcriptional repressor